MSLVPPNDSSATAAPGNPVTAAPPGAGPAAGGALNALVRAFEGGDQGLQGAGKLGLLLCHADGRFDVHHQVFVARTRQALHQFFELAALQRHLAHPGFRDREAGGCVAHQFLGLARHGAGLDGLGSRISRLASKLLLDGVELLPEQAAADQGGNGHRAQKIGAGVPQRCGGCDAHRRASAGRSSGYRVAWSGWS